jgi:hypothetical protein
LQDEEVRQAKRMIWAMIQQHMLHPKANRGKGAFEKWSIIQCGRNMGSLGIWDDES